jgi:hypothetical protein
MDFDTIFGRYSDGIKTKGDLAEALRRLTPLLAFYHTLSSGLGRLCLKNCGGISQDLAVALTLEGFDARVVTRPGHFTTGVNIEDVGVDIDLSHLQFDPEVERIYSYSDFPEEALHDFLMAKIWGNPYLIGRVSIRQPFSTSIFPLSMRLRNDWIEQARQIEKALKRHPNFGTRADAREFLAPLMQ